MSKSKKQEEDLWPEGLFEWIVTILVGVVMVLGLFLWAAVRIFVVLCLASIVGIGTGLWGGFNSKDK